MSGQFVSLRISKLGSAVDAVVGALPALDEYIDELQSQLHYAQTLRRAMASAGEVDRRDLTGDASPVQSMLDRANRARLEGTSDQVSR